MSAGTPEPGGKGGKGAAAPRGIGFGQVGCDRLKFSKISFGFVPFCSKKLWEGRVKRVGGNRKENTGKAPFLRRFFSEISKAAKIFIEIEEDPEKKELLGIDKSKKIVYHNNDKALTWEIFGSGRLKSGRLPAGSHARL